MRSGDVEMLVELRLELLEKMYYLCWHIQTVQASSEVYLKKAKHTKSPNRDAKSTGISGVIQLSC